MNATLNHYPENTPITDYCQEQIKHNSKRLLVIRGSLPLPRSPFR